MHGGSKLSWAVHESWCGFGVNGVKVGLADFFVTVKECAVRSVLKGEGRHSLGSSSRQGHVCNGEVPHGFWFHILAGTLVGDSGRGRSAPVRGVDLMVLCRGTVQYPRKQMLLKAFLVSPLLLVRSPHVSSLETHSFFFLFSCILGCWFLVMLGLSYLHLSLTGSSRCAWAPNDA